MQFKDTIGRNYLFFGAEASAFKLDNLVFDAVEDEDDGYRSMLEAVEVKDPEGLIFFRMPVAIVKVEEVDDGYFNGYRLVDVDDGHVWLRLGTENYDDYYPCYVFEYQPKPPSGS